MDTKDSVIFYQSDFTSSAFCAFEDMRRKGELIDFKITFQNRTYSGHRLVLAAVVPYFRTAFYSPEEEISLRKMDVDCLESIMQFAYSGKIEITSENAQSLLVASEFLQLTQVHDACMEFLEKRLHLNNVWGIRNFAENHHYPGLVALADGYIRQNFVEFSESDSFLALSFTYLKEVLSRDDVKVSTEENVFEAVVRWVKDSPSMRKDMLPDLLSAVRLSFLSPGYLTVRVLSEELLRTSVECRDLIDEAKLYLMSPEKVSVVHSFNTRPRIGEGLFGHRTCRGNTDVCGIYAVCSSECCLSMKKLEPENEKWISLSSFEFPGIICHVAVFSETFYIFLVEGVVTFDAKSLKWYQLEIVNEYVAKSGMVLHNNTFYFFGGEGILFDSDIVLCFDPQLNAWLTEKKMTRRLKYMGVSSLEEYIYITGGIFCGNACNTVERYNPKKMEWTEISPMRSERFDHGCTSLKGKIYVCGGVNDRVDLLNTAEVYDPLTNQWNYISPMNTLRHDLTLVSANEKLYALEKNPRTSRHSVSVEIYDTEKHDWKLCSAKSEGDDRCRMFLVSALVPEI